jgi:hypothetical protein
MKYIQLIFGLSLLGSVSHAQQNEMIPEDTEVWEPVPKEVVPGETEGNQGRYSDH